MTSKKYEMVFDGRSKYVSKNVIFKTPISLDLLHIRLEDSLGNLLNLNSMLFFFYFRTEYNRKSIVKKI